MPILNDDRVLIYDVEPWRGFGFGVPSWGDNPVTVNAAMAELVDEIGRVQLGIMTHLDARRRKPPSRNTMERLFKLLNRIYTVLNARAVSYNQRRLEAGHTDSPVSPFILHPVPYFNRQYVKNRWLREYNRLVMVGLSHAMQHSDNVEPFAITLEFAQEVWQYFREIKRLAAMELLLVPREQAEDDNWWPDASVFDSYDPLKVITTFEWLDDPEPLGGWTEDDLKPLLAGIPATQIRVAVPPTVRRTVGESGGGEPQASAESTGSGLGTPEP